MKPRTTQPLLPNLVIIGAMKCGTTSLHHYMNLHPEVHMSGVKELDFFVKEKNGRRGLKWYQSQFESASVIGESSPNYTKYPSFPDVPSRMHNLIPNAKLIYLVRDPIRRVVSHYLHQYINRAENRSFNEVFSNLDNNHYISCSCYAMQLEQFLKYYSMETSILIVSLEELVRNPVSVLQRIFKFLEIDPNYNHPDFSSVFHKSSDKKRLTDLGSALFNFPLGGRLANLLPFTIAEEIKVPEPDTSVREQLVAVLEKDVFRLRELTGCSFAEWTL